MLTTREKEAGEIILRVENLSKKFCRGLGRSLWYGIRDLTDEMLLRPRNGAELREDEFWALQDVSFELREGETLGLIGHNGAGKSTLLRLINGLIKPDKGSISIRGRVGALIELGAGFNPILTGRENIYVNAAVLGLRRKDIDRHLDEIIDFAEIGDFIDAPLQSYSSGMKVRLGFSVAANLRPDILLIDEVLSVGDSSFRERCIQRLADYKGDGGTIIFVSHNSAAVESISDRVMLLDHGGVLDIGEPGEVVHKYEAKALELSRRADRRLRRSQGPSIEDDSVDDIWFTAVECYDMAGNPRSEFEFGESFEVRLHYETNKDLRLPYFCFGIRKGLDEACSVSAFHMLWDGIHLETIPCKGVIGCVIEAPSFSPGIYNLQILVQSKLTTDLGGKKWYARPKDFGSFTVLPGQFKDRFPEMPGIQIARGIPPVILPHSWKLNGRPLETCRRTGHATSKRET